MNAVVFDHSQEHQESYVIGVDMGLVQIRSAIIKGGKVIREERMSIKRQENSPEVVISLIYRVIDVVLEKQGMLFEEIAGIGIGVPGLVDYSADKIVQLPNVDGWRDIKLAERLSSQFRAKGKISPPIILDNDANAAALGLHFSTKCNNMVYLTISTGIGAGVIIEGRVLRGFKGSAGELGHMIIYGGGDVCTGCNNAGCLEAYSSGKAIAQRAERKRVELAIEDDELDLDWPSHIVRLVEQAYRNNNSYAKEIVERAAEALGLGIVNIANTFNPEKIILGGFVTNLIGDLIVERSNRYLRECALPASHEVIIDKNIKRSEEIPILGAGA